LKVIDSHFHIYKNEQTGILAQGGVPMAGFTGALGEAIPIVDRSPLDRIVAVAVIPIASMRKAAMAKWPADLKASEKTENKLLLEEKLQSRLSGFNEWLLSVGREHEYITPVIAADPTVDETFMTEHILSAMKSDAITALKIHPAANSTCPSDKGYYPVYELAQENDLTVISHGGLSGDDLEGKFCTPEHFQAVCRDFPRLKIVVAHLCYPHSNRLMDLFESCPNLFTDLSFVLGNAPYDDGTLVKMINRFGPDRVLYGSDYPWSDPEKDILRFMRLKLTDSEQERIVYRNAVELFGV